MNKRYLALATALFALSACNTSANDSCGLYVAAATSWTCDGDACVCYDGSACDSPDDCEVTCLTCDDTGAW